MLNRFFTKNDNGEKSQITISEILKGTTAGRMQSVGYMQVIPLISQIEDDRFVSPMEAEVSTKGYGSMVFNNPINKVLIVPNKMVWSDTIVNFTGRDLRRVDLVFGIGYGDDIQQAIDVASLYGRKVIIDDSSRRQFTGQRPTCFG